MSWEGCPSPGAESADDQAGTTTEVIEIERAEVEQIEQLLQQAYRDHPNRLVRAAWNRVKKLTA